MSLKRINKTPDTQLRAVLKYQKEHRDAVNERNRLYRESHKDDDDFVKHRRALQREYYQRKKAKKIAEELENGTTQPPKKRGRKPCKEIFCSKCLEKIEMNI